jgi:hypothetical protein
VFESNEKGSFSMAAVGLCGRPESLALIREYGNMAAPGFVGELPTKREKTEAGLRQIIKRTIN